MWRIRSVLRLGWSVVLFGGSPLVVGAQTMGAPPADVAPVARADSSAGRSTALLARRERQLLVGGTLLSVAAHGADLAVRREVRSDAWQGDDALRALANVGNTWGDPVVLALGAGLWAGGRLGDRPVMARVGFRAVEAITVASLATKVLKGTVGRARPRVSPEDAWDVSFGRGFGSATGNGDYESFPSGHTTAAFAFAAAVTTEVRRVEPARARWVGPVTYGLATATMYARMYRDAHWLSDVTMGATIGTVGGWAVTRWHEAHPQSALDRAALGRTLAPYLAPGLHGATRVGVTLAWR
jgi:membrane-associated phospholipid phosphatase